MILVVLMIVQFVEVKININNHLVWISISRINFISKDCGCNENGIEGDCNDDGICNCTVGYTGDTCYKCDVGYYGPPGYPGYCMECECYSNGTQLCDVKSGNCFCELGYMGYNCRECADGYFDSNSGTFNLDPNCTGNQMYTYILCFPFQ